MKIVFTKYFSDWRFMLVLYLVVAIVASSLKIYLSSTHNINLNNFIIYRNSFYNLIQHNHLYGPIEGQYDLFLYGPLFSFLFAPFALLPLNAGIITWCAFNALVVFTCIYFLENDEKKKTFIWLFIFIELLTAIQNIQINPLIASLFVFTFISFEKEKVQWAAFFVVLSFLLKIFGILGAALFIFYPNKLKFILWCALWFVVLWAVPLLVVSPVELFDHYKNWFATLTEDRGTNMDDISIMHFVSKVFNTNVELTKTTIQLTAIVIFFFKFVNTKFYSNEIYRRFCFASILIWSVIFSHAAESSTYIVAIIGVALFFVNTEKNKLVYALTILVFLFTILAPTDIYPASIRAGYFVPFAIKSFPCFLYWLYIEYRLFRFNEIIH